VNEFPWLTAIAAAPLVGSVVVAAVPREREQADPLGSVRLAKALALLFSLASLALTIGLATQFDADGAGEAGQQGLQFVEQHEWIPAFGVHYAVGVDGISLVLIALTAVLTPIVILSSWNEVDPATARRSAQTFFALVLALEALVLGVFAAADVFLFYVLFEAMLIPMYFLIGSFGGPQRSYAAVKFLLYSLLGGLIMLAAVIGLFVTSRQAGDGTFLFTELVGLDIDPTTQKWLFAGFFFAFAVKAPLWPFHTWLPDAAAEATPGSAVLLVGVLDKVGTFGMIRLCLPLFPDASRFFAPLAIVLCVVGIIYGALLAIGQTDIKRLIAYTSISHFGFIGLGIFAMTTQGQSGSTLYMVNHGFSTGALFIIAGFLISRRGSRLIDDYGGVQKVAPVLAGTFLVAGLSSLSLPGLSSFVSEFLVLVGTFTRYRAAAVVAALGIVLAAVYILWLYQRTMNGPLKAGSEVVTDLRAREVLAIAPLLALIIALGFAPQPVLDVINPSVDRTMSHVRQADPEPPIGVAEGGGQ
jgi:NADH-quinone oxidoreductase subunit M